MMIWNVPNTLTIFRIFLVPFFLYFLVQPDFASRLTGLCIFIAAAITDWLDGRIARRFNQRSEFGKFADPLADKLLVAAALIAFVGIPETLIPFWLVALILFREILITLLRVRALACHESMDTAYLGKVKTAAQMISIVAIMLLLVLRSWLAENRPQPFADGDRFWGNFTGSACWGDFINCLPLGLVSITAFLTVLSGIRYVCLNRHLLHRNPGA